MTLGIWLIWMVIAAAFVIGEIFTLGFFLLWFGIGAAVAGILAIFGLGGSWQWGAFAVVSGVLFVLSRRFAERFSKKQPPGIGADRFIDKKGVVLEEVDNIKNSGRIRMGKEEWRAESDTGEVIPVGKMVEVTRLVGTHVVVKTLKEGE
ncbi:NfeD family protein [Candidatus Aerophobetes bacterium]|uniref:NfeD family protein n=1 Tax=Aerophobetes bacterium TaxID=2030807 RepID=A0A523V0K5_UNCAE|nr:MAG: NfeD family protein [Candidatus Aerophobetes bacterium]